MRVVIDTNVIISAPFWTGNPKQLFNQARRGEITFLTSQNLLEELQEVLVRADKPFRLSAEEANRAVAAIREVATIVETHSRVTVCQDDMDNRVLECAIDGSAAVSLAGISTCSDWGLFKEFRSWRLRTSCVSPRDGPLVLCTPIKNLAPPGFPVFSNSGGHILVDGATTKVRIKGN